MNSLRVTWTGHGMCPVRAARELRAKLPFCAVREHSRPWTRPLTAAARGLADMRQHDALLQLYRSHCIAAPVRAAVSNLPRWGSRTCSSSAVDAAVRPQHDGSASTPAMAQYWSIRGDPQYAGCLVLFQLGQFLEAFFTDAAVMSDVLCIAHTHRGMHAGAPVPMAGVPVFTRDAYIARLVRAGYRVALCEQLDGIAASTAHTHAHTQGGTPGLMRRAVTRVITRGTMMEDVLLAPRAHNYVVCLGVHPLGDRSTVGVAWTDVSTGEAGGVECGKEELAGKLASLGPVEMVVPMEGGGDRGACSAPVSSLEWTCDSDGAAAAQLYDAVLRAARTEARRVRACHTSLQRSTPASWASMELSYASTTLVIPGMDVSEACQVSAFPNTHFRHDPGSVSHLTCAAAGLEAYVNWALQTPGRRLRDTRANVVSVRQTAKPTLAMDAFTRRALEIVRPLHGRRRARGSLLHALDCCSTAMGSRLLDVRLSDPTTDVDVIRARHDAVSYFTEQRDVLLVMRRQLSTVPDAERVLQRIRVSRASVADLLTLRATLNHLPRLGMLLLTQDLHAWGAATLKSTTIERHAITSAVAITDALTSMSDGTDGVAADAGSGRLPASLVAAAQCMLAPMTSAELRGLTPSNETAPPALQRVALLMDALHAALSDGVDGAGRGAILAGFSADLDRWRGLRDSAHLSIAQLQDTLRRHTKLDALRVRYSAETCVLVEVPTRSAAALTRVLNDAADLPAELRLRVTRTLKTSQRVTCDASEQLQRDLMRAAWEVDALENAVLDNIRGLILDALPTLTAVLHAVAAVDVHTTNAQNAITHGLIRPIMLPMSTGSNSPGAPMLDIRGLRHFVVERALLEGWSSTSDADDDDRQPTPAASVGETAGTDVVPRSFVPNDALLGCEHPDFPQNPSIPRELARARTIVLCGPNMGGKSTYTRALSHAVILAQSGAFVPASHAALSVADRLFTRIGAADDLSRHRSTFLAEMEEAAVILRSVSQHSLVLMDEAGRGTAAADGLALAWSILEHLTDSVRCRVLFATHMHELAASAVRSADGRVRVCERVRVMAVHVDTTRGAPLLTHRVVLHPIYAAMEAVRGPDDDVSRLFSAPVWRQAVCASLGVHVARMAGVPQPVLRRAEDILRRLDASSASVAWARAVTDATPALQ